ncbi:MAG: alpha/beta hydrolase [Prevotella sp.]|nr:alpha/beta hydrolase [Prevotella sp.]
MRNQSPTQIDIYKNDTNKVLLILTGLGGTTTGYCNKYVTIAKQATQMGWSVIIAATPNGASLVENEPEYFNALLDQVYQVMENKDLTIYAMGHSQGANILLWCAYLHPQIKRVLSINPVLDWNTHLLNNGVKKFTGERINVICGEKDGSAYYLPMLPQTPKTHITKLPNVDHNFINQLDLFIDLPNRYLFW